MELLCLKDLLMDNDPNRIDVKKLPPELLEYKDLPFAWSEEHQDYVLRLPLEGVEKKKASPPATLSVYFDYTCPFCYIGFAYLAELLPRMPHISLALCPCEAHPAPDPLPQFDPATSEMWQLLQQAAAKAGLPLVHNPTPAHSALAIQGLLWLQENGGDIGVYGQEIFWAMFRDSKDMESIEVLAACAKAAGADSAAFAEALTNGTMRQKQLEANTKAYAQMGIEALPTFVCGKKRYAAALGKGITLPGLAGFMESL